MTTNLLVETREDLRGYGKTFEDIIWIGCDDFQITKENFIKLADTVYDNESSEQEVANDLVLVGKDFWFSRGEHNRSEWWKYNSMPKMSPLIKEVFAITYSQAEANGIEPKGWCDLEALNIGCI